jgi:hypothetical protein
MTRDRRSEPRKKREKELQIEGRTTHHRMRHHIKQQEISLLSAQQPLVDEALGEALAHLLADLKDVPSLAWGMKIKSAVSRGEGDHVGK